MLPHESVQNDTTIRTSTKVIAITKGVFAALLVFSIFSTTAAAWIIIDNQERAANAVTDCIIPTGACYKAKIADTTSLSTAMVMTIVEYCGDLHDKDLHATQLCVEREIKRR